MIEIYELIFSHLSISSFGRYCMELMFLFRSYFTLFTRLIFYQIVSILVLSLFVIMDSNVLKQDDSWESGSSTDLNNYWLMFSRLL